MRAWTLRELGAFLRRSGLWHGTIGLTRPHDQTPLLQTIFAVYTRDAESARGRRERPHRRADRGRAPTGGAAGPDYGVVVDSVNVSVFE